MWIDPLSRKFLSNAGLTPVKQGRGPVVLMYHSISAGNKRPDDRWSVAARNFRNQMFLLKSEGWTIVCVRDLLKADSLPPRTAVITFDDGYGDNFDYSFRVLADIGMRATWFIVSQRVGNQSWLDAGQLKEMAAAGMEIGAHTRTHARLTELDEPGVEEEVSGSKRELEDVLGFAITSFAYPYGLFNDTCVEAVRKANFQVACITRMGWFGSEPDIFKVHRVGIFSDDSLSMFARKVAFAEKVSWKRAVGYVIKGKQRR